MLTSNHNTANVLGIIHGFKKNKIPVIAFQHGITSEISTISDQLSCVHNSNNVNLFVTFNRMSSEVANRQAYIKSKTLTVGLPEKYFNAAKKNRSKFVINF